METPVILMLLKYVRCHFFLLRGIGKMTRKKSIHIFSLGFQEIPHSWLSIGVCQVRFQQYYIDR